MPIFVPYLYLSMIKVKLRTKAIKGNRQAYYLDFYPAIENPETGKQTRREFLGLWIYDEIEHEEQDYFDSNGKPQVRIVPVENRKGEKKKVRLNPIHKLHNLETEKVAEQIRQKKDNQLNKPEIYTGYEKEQLQIKEKGEQSFIEYFAQLANKRNTSNKENSLATLRYLNSFTQNKLKFSELSVKFCHDFRDYLLTSKSNKSKKVTLNQNSAASYFYTFKAALKQAFKDEYLSVDLSSKIHAIKVPEIQRSFLTIEELNKLQKTECRLPVLKQAALFSALTGLRYSDIENLKWNDLEFVKGQGYYLNFKHQKTKGVETLPISEQAYALLGEPKEPKSKVFENLYYSAWVNKQLTKWIEKAGITKKITFHCFRHTYATLQLRYGTDIYTVSKMLGHKKLNTTQIYAKVIDQTKREAASKIKLDF